MEKGFSFITPTKPIQTRAVCRPSEISKKSFEQQERINMSFTPTSPFFIQTIQSLSGLPHISDCIATSELSLGCIEFGSKCMSDCDGFVYGVAFKRSIGYFCCGAHVVRMGKCIDIGEYVVVEADRGEDLGRINSSIPFRFFLEKSDQLSAGKPKVRHNQKKIIRIASQEEVAALHQKSLDEDSATKCVQIICESKFHSIRIRDSEFQ